MQVLRVKVSMSDMLDLDDQPKIIKEGSPQVLTCGDPYTVGTTGFEPATP